MKYRVHNTTDETLVVDFLGVFEPDEEREITTEQADEFRRGRGVPLLETNAPEGAQVTIVVGDEEKEEEE